MRKSPGAWGTQSAGMGTQRLSTSMLVHTAPFQQLIQKGSFQEVFLSGTRKPWQSLPIGPALSPTKKSQQFCEGIMLPRVSLFPISAVLPLPQPVFGFCCPWLCCWQGEQGPKRTTVADGLGCRDVLRLRAEVTIRSSSLTIRACSTVVLKL